MAFSLLQGSVKVGNIHSVDTFGLLREQRSLDIFLTEDRAHFQAIWLVPRGTRHRTLAHEFINQFASLEFQREYAAPDFRVQFRKSPRHRQRAIRSGRALTHTPKKIF